MTTTEKCFFINGVFIEMQENGNSIKVFYRIEGIWNRYIGFGCKVGGMSGLVVIGM